MQQSRPVVVHTATATATGSGSGRIAPSADFVTVTSPNSAYIVTLPYAETGITVALKNGATGYELSSHKPSTVAINGGTGAAAKSTIPANSLVVCVCASPTAWLCSQTATTGASVAVEVAS
jgi:hypothetical protein